MCKWRRTLSDASKSTRQNIIDLHNSGRKKSVSSAQRTKSHPKQTGAGGSDLETAAEVSKYRTPATGTVSVIHVVKAVNGYVSSQYVTLHHEMRWPFSCFFLFSENKFYVIYNGENHFQIRVLVAELHVFEYGRTTFGTFEKTCFHC